MSEGSKLGPVAEALRVEVERLAKEAYASVENLPAAAQAAMVLLLARVVLWNIHHDGSETYEDQAGAYRDTVEFFSRRLIETMPSKKEVLSDREN